MFTARLKQENLLSKSDITNFVKETSFNEKLKTVPSNKNELNELSKKVKVTSTKGLTKNMINKFSILNEAKYFSLWIFQNYLLILPAKNILNILVAVLRLNLGNLMECQKKSWKYK